MTSGTADPNSALLDAVRAVACDVIAASGTEIDRQRRFPKRA